MILETERLYLREMKQSDFSDLCKILQDPDVMYAYEHAFDDVEAQEWLDIQIKRYKDYGYGLWAVILKETGEMIGQCGLTIQEYNNKQVLEIGYHLQKKHWHKGYASEAAIACKRYAFDVLKADEVFSIIRDTNAASQNVAKRNNMTVTDRFVKHYYGVDMPHLVFSVKNASELTGGSMLELIKKRRSTRLFKDEKIQKNVIEEVIKAGLLAPTSKNKKPVELIVVEDRDTLLKLKDCKDKGGVGLGTAPCAIVVIGDSQKSDVWVEDASIAASYMQLEAEYVGLGSVWIQMRKRFNDNGDSEDEVRKLLSIPENYGVLCILALGYKNEAHKPYEESDVDYSKVKFERY